MSVSESEKVGVAILESQFSGKEEHVPIKKRRFMFKSPSPTPPPPARRSKSPVAQENDRILNKCDLSLGSHPEVELVVSASDPHISVDTDDGVDVPKLEKKNAHDDANETVVDMGVCGTSLGQGDGPANVDSGVHDSAVLESSQVLSSNKTCDFLNGLSKDDVRSANVSSEVTDSCITKVPTKDFVASSRVDMSSSNSPSQGNILEATSLHDHSEDVVQELSKDEETIVTHKHSSRDDRFHWDLNTSIEAWECQFDDHAVDPNTNGADAVLKESEDSRPVDKIVITEENCLLREHAVHEADIESTLSRKDLVSVGGIQQTNEVQVDYDSQYEDGELRESIEHTWEEFDVENGEAEHVYYGSKDRDTYSVDTYNLQISMPEGARRKDHRFAYTNSLCYEPDLSLNNVQECNSRSGPKAFPISQVIEAARSSNERAANTCQPFVKPYASEKDAIDKSDGSGQVDKVLGGSLDKLIQMNENHTIKDAVMDLNQSVDFSTEQICQDLLPESCKSNVDIESGVEGCSDIMTAEDNEAKLMGSRGIKVELQSRDEGPTNYGTFLRKNRPLGSRFNDVDYSESRPVREWNTATSFRTGRDSQQFHYRGWRGDRRVGSPEGHRGFKRHFSLSYPGPRKFHCQETERDASVISSKVDKDRFVALNGTIERSVGEGPSNRTWRQITDSSSHDAGRSPRDTNSNRDRGMHLGTRSTEKFSGGSASGGRGRGRCMRRYGPVFDDRRHSGGRCHRPVSDDWSEFPSNYSHNLTGRERSFSPIERKRDFHANRPSRSRTRSPNNWQSPKRRNIATDPTDRPSFEYRNRSPDFRSGGRMQRMRPHQREGFSNGREIDFTPMPRRQGSPQHNTRWIDDREGGNHFRERRASPKNFSPESFGFTESQQRPNKNIYSRTAHPGKYSKTEYEGNYIDRRNGYRHRQVQHPIRRRDSDGALNHFRYDNEGDFVTEDNSCNKGASEFIDRRSPKDYSEGINCQIVGATRQSREERGTFSYRQDANFSANSKSFEVRDIE